MELLEATETEIKRHVGGAERTFVFLNAYDRAELLRADLKRRKDSRAERKQKLIDNLKLAGISGEQMYIELEKFDDADPDDVTESDWIRYVNSPLNDADLYRISLAKTYPAEAEAISKSISLPIGDLAKICGLTLVTKKSADENPPIAPAIPPTFSIPEPESETGLKTDAA